MSGAPDQVQQLIQALGQVSQTFQGIAQLQSQLEAQQLREQILKTQLGEKEAAKQFQSALITALDPFLKSVENSPTIKKRPTDIIKGIDQVKREVMAKYKGTLEPSHMVTIAEQTVQSLIPTDLAESLKLKQQQREIFNKLWAQRQFQLMTAGDQLTEEERARAISIDGQVMFALNKTEADDTRKVLNQADALLDYAKDLQEKFVAVKQTKVGSPEFFRAVNDLNHTIIAANALLGKRILQDRISNEERAMLSDVLGRAMGLLNSIIQNKSASSETAQELLTNIGAAVRNLSTTMRRVKFNTVRTLFLDRQTKKRAQASLLPKPIRERFGLKTAEDEFAFVISSEIVPTTIVGKNGAISIVPTIVAPTKEMKIMQSKDGRVYYNTSSAQLPLTTKSDLMHFVALQLSVGKRLPFVTNIQYNEKGQITNFTLDKKKFAAHMKWSRVAFPETEGAPTQSPFVAIAGSSKEKEGYSGMTPEQRKAYNNFLQELKKQGVDLNSPFQSLVTGSAFRPGR